MPNAGYNAGMSTGLVIGKFMPPHVGHLHLLDCARQQVDSLALILFSKGNEPIPGSLRLTWLRELCPDLEITHISAEHPVDYDDGDAWQFWISAIQAAYPHPPDVVFSSEDYGPELAGRLGARHVLVDPARRHVPISGAAIRAWPMTHWRHIPAPVRPYFASRVCLVGAESTGKTTLAQALAEHFQTIWSPEFARAYLEARGGVCTPLDMLTIARGQVASEDALARQANRLHVCDTSLLTTLIWHEHYFGPAPAELQQLAARRTARLHLLCDIDVPWLADGLRDSPNHRAWFHDRFRRELEARRWPYLLVSGSHEHRLSTAIPAIERILADGSDASA